MPFPLEINFSINSLCSVCDDMGGVSTGDEVMLTPPPELAHCGVPGTVTVP